MTNNFKISKINIICEGLIEKKKYKTNRFEVDVIKQYFLKNTSLLLVKTSINDFSELINFYKELETFFNTKVKIKSFKTVLILDKNLNDNITLFQTFIMLLIKNGDFNKIFLKKYFGFDKIIKMNSSFSYYKINFLDLSNKIENKTKLEITFYIKNKSLKSVLKTFDENLKYILKNYEEYLRNIEAFMLENSIAQFQNFKNKNLKNPNKYTSKNINTFINIHSNLFFTKKILVSFLKNIDYSFKEDNFIKNFNKKYKNKLKFISKNKITHLTKEIKRKNRLLIKSI